MKTRAAAPADGPPGRGDSDTSQLAERRIGRFNRLARGYSSAAVPRPPPRQARPVTAIAPPRPTARYYDEPQGPILRGRRPWKPNCWSPVARRTNSSVALRLPTVLGRGRERRPDGAAPLISRRHCELFEQDGLLMLRDLGSLNGTMVAGPAGGVGAAAAGGGIHRRAADLPGPVRVRG